MKRRVYIDTSVVGGYFDEEFSADTIPFFERVKNGEIIIILSDLLQAELSLAPDFVRELLNTIPQNQIEYLRLSQDAIELADKYIDAKVVGKNQSRSLSTYSYGYTEQSRCFT